MISVTFSETDLLKGRDFFALRQKIWCIFIFLLFIYYKYTQINIIQIPYYAFD